MYISAYISYNEKSAEIDFPVSDEMLDTILRDAEIPTDTTLPFFVEDVHYPLELSALNARTVNLGSNSVKAEVDTYLYGEGEVYIANIYEVASFTGRGEKFFLNPDVHWQSSSEFTIYPPVLRNLYDVLTCD